MFIGSRLVKRQLERLTCLSRQISTMNKDVGQVYVDILTESAKIHA